MRAEINHISQFTFEAQIRNHTFKMDTQVAAGGQNLGPSPKELLLASVIGCTGMDIIASLKKHRAIPTKLLVQGDAEPRSEHPRIFNGIEIKFIAEGSIQPEHLWEAAQQSMTKYCGVSAMIADKVPIKYSVVLNGQEIGQDKARF